MPIKCVVCGACGRMGREIIRLIGEDERFELLGAVERRDHPDLAKDVGYLLFGRNMAVYLEADLRDVIVGADVVIDFTEPDASLFHAEVCADKGAAFVCGTTGFTGEQWEKFTSYAARTRTVYAPNFSVGVFVLRKLVQVAAACLPDWDVEIVEVHHGRKLDAPSGTAKKLAEDVASARGAKGYELVFGREGRVGERRSGELGIHAVRGGDVFGEHTVYLFGPSERLELVHRASSREAFARGALMAAEFVANARERGIYSMEHVVGFEPPADLFGAQRITVPSDDDIPLVEGLEHARADDDSHSEK